MKKDDPQNRDRFEAYPRPSTADEQQKNQPEYIDQQPNDFNDKSISDIPVRNNAQQDEERDLKKEE